MSIEDRPSWEYAGGKSLHMFTLSPTQRWRRISLCGKRTEWSPEALASFQNKNTIPDVKCTECERRLAHPPAD